MISLRDIFTQRPYIITNTDIDGILSALFVKKYYGAEIVGFSNSKDKIWVRPDFTDMRLPVYLDIFIANPEIVTIDQHIISVDDEHLEKLRANPNKMNPNLELGRTFTGDYNHKYPFGTIHYLIARMCGEGVNVELPLLQNTIVGYEHMSLGKILLRADDALYSTQGPYSDNAVNWWKYLYCDVSNNGRPVYDMIAYINSLDRTQASQIKQETNAFFQNVMMCPGADGAFDDITDKNGTVSMLFKMFVNNISQLFGFGPENIPDKYRICSGTFKKLVATAENIGRVKQLVMDDKMFSHAFIYSPTKTFDDNELARGAGNLSCTLSMKNFF